MEVQNTVKAPVAEEFEAYIAEVIADRISKKLESLILPVKEESAMPENPLIADIWQRLDQIEKVSKKATGIGLSDLPIDAETAAAIMGLAPGTIKKYGSYQLVDTIRIGSKGARGSKLQFSLKRCLRLIETGSRKAVIDCTTDITNYRRKKRTTKKEGKHGKKTG